MHHLCDVFEVLFNPEVDVGCSVEKLTLAYPNDFLKCDLETEFLRYREIFAHFESKIIGDVPKMLNEIYRCELQNFIPQVCIALRIFATIPVTVCSGERSFSKLALIKNKLRSTMGQGRLNSLTILSIESNLARKVDFHDVLKNFALKKARKALVV